MANSQPICITVDKLQIEQVTKYKYLSVTVTDNGRDDEEVRTRLGTARVWFNNLERILRDRKVKTELRIRILKCYIWSLVIRITFVFSHQEQK